MHSIATLTSGTPKVYIVDDDAAVRSAIAMLVETCDWDVVACASAEEFFSCYVPGENQCLILDLHMPGQGGIDVQSRLDKQADPLPVILVTAHSEQPEARLAASRGAIAVFGKPFDSAKLLECLHAVLAESPTQESKIKQ